MSDEPAITIQEEDLLLSEGDYIAIPIGFGEGIPNQPELSESDISEISRSAANLVIVACTPKRQREYSEEDRDSSNLEYSGPPTKKCKKIMMDPLEPVNPQGQQPPKEIVRLIPDIEDIHLFTESHLVVLHKSVLKALKACRNPNVKFDLCKPDRGQYKFVCPNEDAKEFALNIVQSLTELWEKPMIKAVDCEPVPRMIRASITFDNPAPETLDFFEEVDFKNETIDTNNWRAYGKKKIQGNKTVIFIGIDEKSVADLKGIGFRPYYENGRIKITINNTNQNNQ